MAPKKKSRMRFETKDTVVRLNEDQEVRAVRVWKNEVYILRSEVNADDPHDELNWREDVRLDVVIYNEKGVQVGDVALEANELIDKAQNAIANFYGYRSVERLRSAHRELDNIISQFDGDNASIEFIMGQFKKLKNAQKIIQNMPRCFFTKSDLVMDEGNSITYLLIACEGDEVMEILIPIAYASGFVPFGNFPHVIYGGGNEGNGNFEDITEYDVDGLEFLQDSLAEPEFAVSAEFVGVPIDDLQELADDIASYEYSKINNGIVIITYNRAILGISADTRRLLFYYRFNNAKGRIASSNELVDVIAEDRSITFSRRDPLKTALLASTREGEVIHENFGDRFLYDPIIWRRVNEYIEEKRDE